MTLPSPARLALGATLLLATAAPAQQPAPASAAGDSVLARGRALSDWSSLESMTALHGAASPELKQAIDGGGGPAGFVALIGGQLGKQVRVVDESTTVVNGIRTYMRLADHEKAPAIMTTIAWREDGTVLAAGARPSSAPIAPPADAAPAYPVRLPFGAPGDGSWYTVWGGTNAARNYHVVSPTQRNAYDFLLMRDGRTLAGPADTLASYHCWGQAVLAAADGVVTEAVGDLPDQAIGASDRANPSGNHVVLRHAADRHSVVAHLQKGSVTVTVGDSVRAGQPIGRCGNSGNTSEPHIHFQLQTGATFAQGGVGVPSAFQNAIVDGHPARAGEPVRGQSVRPR